MGKKVTSSTDNRFQFTPVSRDPEGRTGSCNIIHYVTNTSQQQQIKIMDQRKRHSMTEQTCQQQERSLSQAERNVVNFIQSSQPPESPSNRPFVMVRSNSYTLQDVEKQRRSIQASMEACNDQHTSYLHPLEACEDDPNYRYYHSMSSVKRRRVSKSLPELNHLRHFPLVTTRYQGDNNDDPYDDDDDDDSNSRGTRDIPEKTAWSGKSEFIFTGIVLALGLNNLWRFPYFAYKFHAGSFLFCYISCMLLIGLPLLSLEYALGQLTRRGPIAAFGGLCPLLKGVPIAASIIAFLSAPMYSTINSWSLFYFFKSFYSIPLWSKCDNSWNTDDCSKNGTVIKFVADDAKDAFHGNNSSSYIDLFPDYDTGDDNSTNVQLNKTVATEILDAFSLHSSESTNITNNLTNGNNDTQQPDLHSLMSSTYSPLVLPTQQFFDVKLLELDVDSYAWGQIQWELIIFVLITWTAVFLSLRRNILFSTHPSSCFSLLPYLILLVLFVRTLMFEGTYKGIAYFFQPSWNHLTSPDIWLYSAGLSIHSVATILGISFAKATCNRERNNFLRDAFIICFINIATVVFIGMIVFATLGNLAHKRRVDISLVLNKDPGFAFVAFSELLSSIPFTSFWSCVFFFTLFCLGVDYQISMIRSFLVAIEDAYGSHVKRNFLAHQLFALIVSVLGMLLTLIFLTQQGLLLIQAFDQYLTVVLTLILSFFQVILMGWFYGGSNLAQVIRLKISKKLGCFFPCSWIFVTPVCLLSILSWSAVYYEEPLFRDTHKFPMIMHSIVVGIAILLMLLIPILGYYQVLKTPTHESFLNRVILACKPFEKAVPNVPLVQDLEAPTSATFSSPQSNHVENHYHGHQKEPSPLSSNRRPSILTQDWSKIKLQISDSRKQSSSNSSSSSVKQDAKSPTSSSSCKQPFISKDEEVESNPVPVTSTLIQEKDRETEL